MGDVDLDDPVGERAQDPDRARPLRQIGAADGELDHRTQTVRGGVDPGQLIPVAPGDHPQMPSANTSRPWSKIFPAGIVATILIRPGSILVMLLPEHDQTAPPPAPMPWQ
jgi:hypothetical protein